MNEQNPISKSLKAWQDAINLGNKPHEVEYVPDDELPEDIRENVTLIRQFMEDNDIDPSSLIVESIDYGNSGVADTISPTITLSYDNFISK